MGVLVHIKRKGCIYLQGVNIEPLHPPQLGQVERGYNSVML